MTGAGPPVAAERGLALVVVMLALVLMSAIGGALALLTVEEPAIAANERAHEQAIHAAEAILAATVADLRTQADWSAVLGGAAGPAFLDVAPGAIRPLPDGTSLDLDVLVHQANCGRPAPCSNAAMAAVSAARPWGDNNPRWRLWSHGWLDDLIGDGPTGVVFYLAALVGDDGAENDGDPLRDGFRIGPMPNPGGDIILVRGHAFGPRAAYYAIEGALRRLPADPLNPLSPRAIRLLSWQPVQ